MILSKSCLTRMVHLGALAMVILSSGCVSQFIVTETETFKAWRREADRKGYVTSYPSAVSTIGSHQVPVAFLVGYDGQTINLRLRNAVTGAVVIEKTFYISTPSWAVPPSEPLEPGSYVWEIIQNGQVVDSRQFTVAQ